MVDRREQLTNARLYLVIEAGPAERVVPEAVAGGVDVVQLRDRSLTDEELVAAGRRMRELCGEALLFVNDRPDLARACGADGVHLGQDDLPVSSVEDDLLVGLSTHSPAQLSEGLASRADYLSVGPVWETPTKPGRPAAGLDYVRHAAATCHKPWFAIGGIDPGTIGEVVAAGATRAVVVRAIRDATDPRAAAASLRGALEREPAHAE